MVCARRLRSHGAALLALLCLIDVRPAAARDPGPAQAYRAPAAKSGTEPAARQATTPVDDPVRLVLTPKWNGKALQVGVLNPRLHQIALRGALAVVPLNLLSTPAGAGQRNRAHGVAILDAREGEILRVIRAPGEASGLVHGVALDGEAVVFAVQAAFPAGAGVGNEVGGSKRPGRGLLVKASLDGTYTWLAARIGDPRGAPVLLDLNGDGTRDAAVVTVEPNEISAWDGRNGGLLFRSAAPSCELARLRALRTGQTDMLVLSCDDALHVVRPDGKLVPNQLHDLLGGVTSDLPIKGLPEGQQLSPWYLPALLGYTALDAPERDGTSFLDRDAARWTYESLRAPLPAVALRGPEGAIVGGVFDAGRYGAILLNAAGDNRLVGVARRDAELVPAAIAERPSLEDAWTTLAVDDVDGDGLWDLLAADNEGNLRAYGTTGSGQLYQAEPHGDVLASGVPQATFRTPKSAAPAQDVRRWKPSTADAQPSAAFVHPQSFWTEIRLGLHNDMFTSMPDNGSSSAPIVSYWLKGDLCSASECPLLQDAQQGAFGIFAHDRVRLLFQPKDDTVWRSVGLPATSIQALAVDDRQLAVAASGRLFACDARGAGCNPVDANFDGHALSALTRDPSSQGFLLGLEDGTISRFEGSQLRSLGAHTGEAIAYLAAVADEDGAGFVLASGKQQTWVQRIAAGELTGEATLLTLPLEQVLRCDASSPMYARSQGVLLETSDPRAGFAQTKDAPPNVRTLGCDRDGGLVVVSLTQGTYVLPAPPRFPRVLWQIAFGIAVVGLLVQLVLTRLKLAYTREHASGATAHARRIIVPEEPLMRLPSDRDRHIGLHQLIEALVAFIDNADTRPPATIGIYGPWGSGKSSVMQALRHELEKKHRYISVWFNPWRFHREPDLAAALLQSVVTEVKEHLGVGRLLVALRALGHKRTLITLSWMLPLGGLSCYYAGDELPRLLKALVEADFDTTKFDLGTLGATIGSGTLVSAFVKSGTKLFKVFGVNPSDLLKAETPEKRIDFFRRFGDELARVADALPRKQSVVVYVDDLDRCPADQVVAVLEALNMLAESRRIYLVLGLDPRLVCRAIELKHRDMLALMAQRGERVDDFGARFLEKIVSLAVHVPTVRAADVEHNAHAEHSAERDADPWLTRMLDFLWRDSRALPLAWVLLCSLLVAWLSVDAIRHTWNAQPWAALDKAPKLPSKPTAEIDKRATPPAGTAPPADLGAVLPERKQVSEQEASRKSAQPSRGLLARFRREVRAETAAAPAVQAPIDVPVSAEAPDAAHTKARRQRLIQAVVLASCMLMTGYLLFVLELRRRQLKQIGPRTTDSDEFALALSAYLTELPPNPRNIIRRANLVRLLYHIVAAQQGNGCDTKQFFACLVAVDRAEHLRASGVSTAGIGDELEMTRAVLARRPGAKAVDPQALEKVLSSFPPSAFEEVSEVDLPAVHGMSQTVHGWMHGTLH